MGTLVTILTGGVCVVAGAVCTWILGIIRDRISQKELIDKLRDAVLDREHVSINEEFLMTQMLAEKIKEAGFAPDLIFAVCPGGAMIAEWLARRFLGDHDTPTPVQLLYTTPVRKEDPSHGRTDMKVDDRWTAIPPALSDDSKVLIVNDISRTGDTLKAACDFVASHVKAENLQSATLIYSVMSHSVPTYHVAKTPKNVRFDWKSH